MKRRVTQLVVLLLLGAIVNVAVAWGCVINPWLEYKTNRLRLQEHHLRWWAQRAPEGMSKPQHASEFRLPGVTIVRIACEWKPMRGSTDEVLEEMYRTSAGIPVRSLYGQSYTSNAIIVRYGQLDLSSMISNRNRSGRLPWYPLWPGFAINTIFYAAMLCVLFFAPAMVKRSLRRRRGQCPACAYPIGTSAVCTECGAALKPQATLDQ